MNGFGFANPWALVLLLLVPLAVWTLTRHGRGGLRHPRASALGRAPARRAAELLARMPGALRVAATIALIIGIAGPRTGQAVVDVDAEGIAIMLVLDVSSSMLAEDFSPQNRLAVAKLTTAHFIQGRQYDRIGMVAFSGEALTQVPLTIDYPVLFRALEQLRVGMMEDGTAIGTGLATGASRLRDAAGKSRVMILMTDGENNRGQIDPITAARAAATFGIRVYTIGVGTEGVARVPVARGVFGGYQYANIPVHIDEELLTEISDITGGRYFRATNEAALDSIYQTIDELEKTTVEVRRYTNYMPHYLPFVLLAISALLAEWLLRASRWGRVP